MSEPMPIPQESPESLDKVRDILFGSQMRAVDQRLEQIEKRMLSELADLRAELENRFAVSAASAEEQGKAMRRVEESFTEAVAVLRREKADTASLVQLLADMAERLAGDLEDPARG